MTELWLGTDINADQVPLVEQADQWLQSRELCAMLQGYGQQVGADYEDQYHVGLNYHQRLVEHVFYRRLLEMGMPLAYEVAGIKAWSITNGVSNGQAEFGLQNLFNRVRAAGGDVATFSTDDLIAAAQHDISPALTMDQIVAAAVRVFEVGEANGVRGGITEAFPLTSAADIVHFIERMQQAGHGPVHLHLDIDEQHLKQTMSPTQIESDLRWMQAQCRAWTQGTAVCHFGVIINGQRGNTPEDYKAGLEEWFAYVRRMLDGDADRYILQSWKGSDPATRQPNGLPVNLPESDSLSHSGLLLEVGRILGLPFSESHR